MAGIAAVFSKWPEQQRGVGDNAAGGAPGFPFQLPDPLVDWHVHEQ